MFKFWKRKKNKHIVGTNNIITVIDNKGNKHIVDKIKGITININGNNNKIIMYGNRIFNNCSFFIDGDNCIIEILETKLKSLHDLHINFYNKITNCKCIIGKNFDTQQTNIIFLDSNNTITIGDNCLFSWNIQIISSDGYSIYDETTKKLLNPSNTIKIGNHCWVGSDVKILKNVELADNIICGANSLVTNSCLIPNTVIAGMLAKVVKENVSWYVLPPSKFNSDIV